MKIFVWWTNFELGGQAGTTYTVIDYMIVSFTKNSGLVFNIKNFGG